MIMQSPTDSLTQPFAIIGAGPVGQSLALLLHDALIASGYTSQQAAQAIHIYDARSKESALNDKRTIALSAGSLQILSSLKALPQQVSPIQEIHISRQSHFGKSLITAQEYHMPQLGGVASYTHIMAPLEQALTQRGMTIQRPIDLLAVDKLMLSPDETSAPLSQVSKIGVGKRSCASTPCASQRQHTFAQQLVQRHQDMDTSSIALQAKTADGYRTLTPSYSLVIQAEGGTFDTQSARTQHYDYQQTAIISYVSCSHFQATRAYERFTSEGPIALLPHQNTYALVWCTSPEKARNLMDLSDADFLLALQKHFGQRVGEFTHTEKRFSFPLGLNALNSEDLIGSNWVKIGNAAQTLHPVAGQGLNLGLRDAMDLVNSLKKYGHLHEHHQLHQHLPRLMQHYSKQRTMDRTITIQFTHHLATLFTVPPTLTSNSTPYTPTLTQTLLGMGIYELQQFPFAKKALAKHMMFGYR